MDDPGRKREEGNGSSGKLLEPQEKIRCEQIAGGEPPNSQRAQALLALDGGKTQAEASRASGLSVGQVRYWLGRFRSNRMSIFPSESPDADQKAKPDAKRESDAAKAKPEAEEKTVEKGKKKAKKGKKKKAKQKDKKGKKKAKKKGKKKKAKKSKKGKK